MDVLKFAKELMLEITNETSRKCVINEKNQIDVYINDNEKYAIELMPTWKQYLQSSGDKNVLERFKQSQIKLVNKIVGEINEMSPEDNLEKLILKLAPKKVIKDTVIQKEVTKDLVLIVCLETDEYCKAIDLSHLNKFGVDHIWETAKRNSLNKGYKEPIVVTENELFEIEMYDNSDGDLSYQFVVPQNIKNNLCDKFIAIPEEGQILVFKFVTEKRDEQMMALNYLKERVQSRYMNSNEPFSEEIYYYNKENKLEVF